MYLPVVRGRIPPAAERRKARRGPPETFGSPLELSVALIGARKENAVRAELQFGYGLQEATEFVLCWLRGSGSEALLIQRNELRSNHWREFIQARCLSLSHPLRFRLEPKAFDERLKVGRHKASVAAGGRFRDTGGAKLEGRVRRVRRHGHRRPASHPPSRPPRFNEPFSSQPQVRCACQLERPRLTGCRCYWTRTMIRSGRAECRRLFDRADVAIRRVYLHGTKRLRTGWSRSSDPWRVGPAPDLTIHADRSTRPDGRAGIGVRADRQLGLRSSQCGGRPGPEICTGSVPRPQTSSCELGGERGSMPAAGKVVAQNRKPGSVLPAGTVVMVTLGKG
jgi:hypothetical protein